MSDQQQDQEPEGQEIEATGELKDGRITITASLGGAQIEFSWAVNGDEQEIDALLASAPTVGMAVVNRILEEQAADRG